MVTLKLIGKKGSKSAKEIRQGTKIGIYKGNKAGKIDALVNYGLAGAKFDAFMKRWPSARTMPIVNRTVGFSKLSVCHRAKEKDIPVPESKLTLSKGDNMDEWIEKRTNSIKGLGIKKATKRKIRSGKYFQKYVDNRKYELRVHAFKWIPQNEWRLHKRVGKPDEIAWNYANGGKFITVNNPGSYTVFTEAQKIAGQILDLLGMAFGAVDLLVDSSHNLYFIEINSSPGFSDLSRPIYVDAFTRLKNVSQKELKGLVS